MKKAILLALITCTTFSAFCQDKLLTVKPTSIRPDSAFSYEPVKLLLRMTGFNDRFDSVFVYFETSYRKTDTTERYNSIETFTRGTTILPFDAWRAGFNADGSYNYAVINAILAAFYLEAYEPETSQ